MKRFAVILIALAACDPQLVIDKAMARTAESVVAPVTGAAAARCLVSNATPDEVQRLARDVGVEAGTSTLATIRSIAGRPGTLSCLASAGLPPVQA